MKPSKPRPKKELVEIIAGNSRQRIIQHLCKFPDKEFSLSDLAKAAKIAKPHIGEVLHDLVKKDLIKIEKLSKIWRIRANLQSKDFVRTKIIYNLNFVYQSGLIEFLENYFNNPKSIILFGSFRNGDDISNSDIDLAIESVEIADFETISIKSLGPYEHAINRKIQVHLFSRANVDENVFSNIANGIVLSGFLEVKK